MNISLRTPSGSHVERSRATIEQAKGALMATFAIEPGEAFDLLVQESQNGKTKLRSVAEQVVDAASRGHPVQMRGTQVG